MFDTQGQALVLLTHALTLYIYDIILYIIIFEMKRT